MPFEIKVIAIIHRQRLDYLLVDLLGRFLFPELSAGG